MMPIRDHIRSANAGMSLGSIMAMALSAGGLLLGFPGAMTALITGACIWGACTAVGLVCGRLNPQQNTFRKLSFAAGLGAAAFCMFSFAGPGPQAQHNRDRFFSETRALVAKFERAANGTPQPKHNNAPVRPAPVQPDKNTGWIGVAPGGSSTR
ncbi:MAG: hypothetical protein EPN97_18140 [Alphaproteobacteria bacterium]|nr:MAG: hypothetical protein EPN97_18140 [Alphaproteobacteria bacterium]